MNDEKTRLRCWKKQQGPLAGFISGTLLMVPGIFPFLGPIQVLALVPLLVALRRIRRWRKCFGTGFLMGLGFIAPQILWLQLPTEISLILVAYFIVLLMALVAVSWALVRTTGIMGCFAFGALVAVFDRVVMTAMPIWGTAQSFARCWSWYPRMIAFTCATGIHDDNYTDISRRYGAKSTGIVVVPTNDWIYVRKAHFQNSIHRAIESRFAIVRAASNGISAIISPTGKRLAVSDHFKEDSILLVTDVPVYDVRTIFSRFGYWFVVASGLLVVVYLILERGKDLLIGE